MIHASVALPIPVGGDVPPILTVLLGIAAVAVFAVIVWQAVRYFQNGGGDDE